VTKTVGGQAAITVLSVLSLGGKGERATGQSNRVKVTLSPVGVGGRPLEVSSQGRRLPDPSIGG